MHRQITRGWQHERISNRWSLKCEGRELEVVSQRLGLISFESVEIESCRCVALLDVIHESDSERILKMFSGVVRREGRDQKSDSAKQNAKAKQKGRFADEFQESG